MNNENNEDSLLLSTLLKAEQKGKFPPISQAIACYEAHPPIPLTLSSQDILGALKKCVIVNCNSIYAKNLNKTKKDIIGKLCFEDNLPKGTGNIDILNYILHNNFWANHIESFEKTSNGRTKWFLNRIFLEVGNSHILRIWIRKIDITDQKELQFSLEKLNIHLKEQQNLQLQQALKNTISALSNMLEQRDAYTSGHQKRVAQIALAIANEYGFESDRSHWLEIAASVHDIGKISVPSEILSKPTKLSPAEFALMKMHPETGYQILKDIDFPGPVADIVRQHHEYLDGSGYPLGLKDRDILLESKILTVSDIVESMISHRPYRPALPVEAALNEIKRLKGIKLDPNAVDICVRLFESKAFGFSSEHETKR